MKIVWLTLRKTTNKILEVKEFMIFTHYFIFANFISFRFLSMLEEEVYGENSPVWDDDFTVPQSLSLGPSRLVSPLTPLTDKEDSLVATARYVKLLYQNDCSLIDFKQ